ncbi:MAG: 3',5'-cyclic-AMP phosphodiesterase [Gammaproteobacteria bacterium]
MPRILQITDLHVKPHASETMLGIDTEHFFQQTLAHAHDHHAPFDLILLTGDLCQDPNSESYQRICLHLKQYDTRCLCLPGNHDDFTLMKKHLAAGKIDCGRLLHLDSWLIIALNSQKPNSPVGNLADDELDFLEATLLRNSASPTLIALHHHCMPSGSPWLDTMQVQNSKAFLEIIRNFPQVKAVTFGHIHQAFFSQIDQIAIFGTPSSCFQFTPNSNEFTIDDTPPGYRVFQLLDNGELQSACYRLPIIMNQLDRSARAY